MMAQILKMKTPILEIKKTCLWLDTLVCWFVGLSDFWIVGLLVYWFIGLLLVACVLSCLLCCACQCWCGLFCKKKMMFYIDDRGRGGGGVGSLCHPFSLDPYIESCMFLSYEGLHDVCMGNMDITPTFGCGLSLLVMPKIKMRDFMISPLSLGGGGGDTLWNPPTRNCLFVSKDTNILWQWI